jgi:hypothetical protein
LGAIWRWLGSRYFMGASMTDATFNISFVPFKTAEMGLVWTSTSSDVRPTFELQNVDEPQVGDVLHFYFDGVDYSATMTNDETYKLKLRFPEIPEILNGTYDVYAEWHRGAAVTTSNTVSVTIDVPETVPVVNGTPTIVRVDDTFTVTPTSVTARPLSTTTYQWYRDASPISGQTGTTYTYTSPDDEDTTITCVQTETNSEGADTATSNGIDVPYDPWVKSATVPALFNMALATNTHTFTGIDFKAGTALIGVYQNVPTRTMTSLMVGDNAATRIGVVQDSGQDVIAVYKYPIPSDGNYDVTLTLNANGGICGILCGTLEGVSSTHTDLQTFGIDNADPPPHEVDGAITVPTGGIGLTFFASGNNMTTSWRSPVRVSVEVRGASETTLGWGYHFDNTTPAINSHDSSGLAMIATAWGP